MNQIVVYGGGRRGLSAYEDYVEQTTADGGVPVTRAAWLETLRANGFEVFADRAALSATAAVDGRLYYDFAADRTYIGSTGATAIPDLPGRLVVGTPTPEHFGQNATPGVTAMGTALQAMMDYARDRSLSWRARGVYNIGGTLLDTYTAFDARGMDLYATASDETTPGFRTLPLPADSWLEDATLLAAVNASVATGIWKRGVRAIPALGAYAGKCIYLSSSQNYIIRSTDPTSYRHDLVIRIIDTEGVMANPLPYDIADDIVFTVCEGHTVREPITVYMPRMILASGTGERNYLMSIDRSNTDAIGGDFVNLTAQEHNHTVMFRKCASVSWTSGDFARTEEHGTAYTVGIYNVNGWTLRDMGPGGGAKRFLNADYAYNGTIEGGSFPDGLVGHFVFNLTIDGAYVSTDDPNQAPLKAAGGDLVAVNCTLARKGAGPMAIAREDVFEIRGGWRIIGGTATWDLQDEEAGNADCPMFEMGAPNGTHDWGRDVHLPDVIECSGTLVNFLGTVATPRLWLLHLRTTKNDDGDGDDIIVDTDLIWDRVTVRDESGLAEYRVQGVRRSNWVGPGLRARINIMDDRDLTVYWGAVSGNPSATLARSVWNIQTQGAVALRLDGQAYSRYLVDCASISFDTAEGGMSLVGDEEAWHRIKGGSPTRRLGNLADDAAVSFPAGSIYGYYTLIQRNAAGDALAAIFVSDTVASDGVTIVQGVGATFAGSSAVLDGTTGVDGEFTISSNTGTGRIYFENRTDATVNGVTVVMHSEPQ